MESSSTESHNGDGGEGNGVGFSANCREQLCSAVDKLRSTVVGGVVGKLAKVAGDDPRRVVHSLKVGLALTLVSVLYYVTPLFNEWGDSFIWAVVTVVVVMEFTVGATLSRGLNRTCATLVAVFLAVGAHMAAGLCGENGEPILLSVLVFLVGSAATFLRFIPELKARYDYGVMIFILTFSMVAVSSYRVDELLEFAHERVTTVAVGVTICLFTTVFVFPIWAGEDLHMLGASSLNKLAEFLEGMESECFRENSPCENLEGKAFLQVYKDVLNSKVREDSLCTFAMWEPIHGKFRFRHPWSQYQKLGALCRQCAASMEVLASCVVVLKKSQHPEANPELCLKIRATCGAMSLHSAKVLRGLSVAVRTMTIPCQTNNMFAAAKAATDFRTQLSEDAALLQVMHAAVVASRLSDVVIQIERITESTSKLAQLARFTNPERPLSAVVINIED